MYRRPSAVADVESHLLGRAFPRLMMSLLLAISGGVAFLAAFGLLKAGVLSMAVRYGVAAVVGYALLLGMFRLWLWAAMRRMARGNREPRRCRSEISGADLAATRGYTISPLVTCDRVRTGVHSATPPATPSPAPRAMPATPAPSSPRPRLPRAAHRSRRTSLDPPG